MKTFWNQVLKFAAFKERCEFEMRQYLARKKVDSETSENYITRLKDLDFLNEKRFIKAYLHDNFCLKNKSIARIKLELLARGLNKELINSEATSYSEEENIAKAEHIITKKLPQLKNLPGQTIKRRLLGKLVRLGFSPQISTELIDKQLKKMLKYKRNAVE